MCAPEFPPYLHLLKYTPHDAIISHDWVKKYFGIGKVMELNEQAEEKTKMKRRRKRVKKESDGEVMENYLKRKPSTPVKPPVPKKARVPLKDVTDFVVVDSGSSQSVQPVKKETDVDLREEVTDEALKQLLKEQQRETLKLDEALKEESQRADEVLQKLLRELDGLKVLDKYCPIHHCRAEIFNANQTYNGAIYYRCGNDKCVLFCNDDEDPLYFDTVNRQLHEDYRDKDRLPCCFCHRCPVLKVSKSDKKHGRLYMNCGQPQRCEFFQWADSPLTLKNKKWMGWAPEVKLLTELDPGVDGEGPIYTCPIHRTPLEVHVANNGWEYCKCSIGKPCMMFCGKKEARHYLKAVRDQLFLAYKCKDQLPVCFCRSVPVLKISSSDKNYGRLYMACSRKDKCDFFQWADVPLFDKNRDWMQGQEQEKKWEWMRSSSKENRDRPLMVEDGIIEGPDDCPFRGLRYSAEMEEAWGRLRRLYERSSLII